MNTLTYNVPKTAPEKHQNQGTNIEHKPKNHNNQNTLNKTYPHPNQTLSQQPQQNI